MRRQLRIPCHVCSPTRRPSRGQRGWRVDRAEQQQAAAVLGLAPEIGAVLGAGRRHVRRRARDRAALAKFYEARQYEPVWVTSSGLEPAGQAVVAELAKADDWGLEASAFRLPAMPAAGAELSRADRAKCRRGDQPCRAEVRPPRPRRPHGPDRAQQVHRPQAARLPIRAWSSKTWPRLVSPMPTCAACIRSIPSSSACGRNTWPSRRGQSVAQSEPAAPAGAKKPAAPEAPSARAAARQHGAMALDAGVARRLLRLGQRA